MMLAHAVVAMSEKSRPLCGVHHSHTFPMTGLLRAAQI